MVPKLGMLAYAPAHNLLMPIKASVPRLYCDAFQMYELAGQ